VVRATWELPPVFRTLLDLGVSRSDAELTFNMGIGMLAVVPDADRVLAVLAERGVPAWVCGQVRERLDTDRGDSAAKGGSGGTVALVG
jgi:phosphoribosylformylglycinamidine cyclo-ligase